MKLENLNVEQLEQLEVERNKTFADPLYQQWVKELNISQSYEDREGIIRANDINNQYDYSNLADNKSPKFSVRSIVSLLNW